MKVTAIVLAAGVATRMGDICKKTPKPMLPLDGKPFLRYLVEWLIGSDFDEIILSAGHLGEQISAYFGNDQWQSGGVQVIREKEPIGTGETIRFAASHASQETIFLCNADTIVEMDLPTIIHTSAIIHRPVISIVTLNESVPNQGAVKVESGIVTEFREDGSAIPLTKSGKHFRASSTGCYFVQKSFVLSEHFRYGSSLEKEIIPRLVKDRLVGAVVCGTGIFFEFGVPERYAFLKKNTWLLKKAYRIGL